jgi:SAM-dependent methyltransferase
VSDWDGEEGAHWALEAERYSRMLAPFGDRLVGAAGLSPGEAVLDVGCGCGDVSLAAARALGASGRVTGVDLSAAMLDVARARAEREGVHQASFLQADAARHRAAQPADVVLSRFGVMFFDDPTAAFTNLRANLRRGGRLQFLCWQELFANEWMIVPGAAVTEVLPLPAGGETGAAGPFALADAGHIQAVLEAAGFHGVGIDGVEAPMWMGDDADDAVAFLQVTGMGRALFSDAEPEAVREALQRATDALTPHVGAEGVVLQGAAWLVAATA